ncbi:Cytochrome c nitrite reductase subunit NrfH [Sporomusa carbonis]|uniref:cytochrome c3 family protein n=1 Tax=Sporomusa carbonis TaxID=3076075 RepID=UPI003A676EB6
MELKNYLDKKSLTLILLGMVAAFAGLAVAGGGMAYADNAAFCSSCHSMQRVAATWQVSNHRQFTCGDCHLPHDNIVHKMYVKSQTGMHDTYHEFLRDYPDTIKLTANARAIVDSNCLRCHAYTVGNTPLAAGGQQCTKCHRGMIHNQIVVKEEVRVE